jgi:hypothetical protein
MENVFLKHLEIKNQIRQIITNEYQENRDFTCIPSDNPAKDILSFEKDVCRKFNELRPDHIELKKYIYMIPDIKHNRIVVKF